MQTPKPRNSSLEVPQRASPRAARKLKTVGLEPNSVSSPSSACRTPKERSPKVVVERRSPRSPVSEKKRPSRISELESQVSQLQEDLKKTNDQLTATESWKKQAELDADESQKQILELNTKLEESQNRLLKLSTKEACVGELQNTLPESEQTKSTDCEFQKLKEEFAETLSVIQNMKEELKHSKESEFRAEALASETLLQLENAKKTMEGLKSDSTKANEAYNSISLELEDSRARMNELEGVVSKLKADLESYDQPAKNSLEGEQNELAEKLRSLKSESEQLRSSLKAAEAKCHEEQIRSTAELRNAYEMVERVKTESNKKESELKDEFQRARSDIEEMKANLMDKETELQGILEENEQLHVKIKKTSTGSRESEMENDLRRLKETVRNLKANLMDRETELQNISEENEMLKIEIGNTNMDRGNIIEAAKAAEREAVIKLEIVMDEADRSSRKASRVAEQLDAAQVVNAEMETELRKLKVQSDQWRKAAEAAAAMISAGNNGKFMERTGSLDSNYNPVSTKITSPYSEDIDDDLMKKKNGNMLKKIGVLWKKPPK